MIKKPNYIKAIADGVIQGFCGTKLLLGFSTSQFASEISLQFNIVVAGIIALFTAILYFLLIHNEINNKNLIKLSSISFLCFVISSPILFALPFTIFTQRELGNADGFLIMFVFSSFLITAIVIRLGILVGVLVKNKKKA